MLKDEDMNKNIQEESKSGKNKKASEIEHINEASKKIEVNKAPQKLKKTEKSKKSNAVNKPNKPDKFEPRSLKYPNKIENPESKPSNELRIKAYPVFKHLK